MHRMTLIGFTIVALALSQGTGASEVDVVAVVSSKSTLTTLTKSQVAQIFLGKSDHFPDGSQALPIDQAEGTVARDAFYTKYTGKSAAVVKAYWSKMVFTGRGLPPKAVSNSLEIRKVLAQNPNAIGYIEQNLVDSSLRVIVTQ